MHEGRKKVALAVFMGVNVLLGTGPIIVPMPFLQAGALLSAAWLVINCGLSFLTAGYVAECQLICRDIDTQRSSFYRDFSDSAADLPLEEGPRRTYEYGDIGMRCFGNLGRVLYSFSIVVYVSGVILAKCILTGRTLSTVFKDVQVLDRYEFWLGLFFVVSAVFSFRDVGSTKYVQYLSMAMRFLTILLFILGALIVLGRGGSQGFSPPGYPLVQLDNFPEIFSNTVFSYNFHHSLTSVVAALSPAQTKRTLLLIYGFVLATMLVIPTTGVLAFGAGLADKTELKYYNENFQGLRGLSWIYYVTSFYIFLNVAALPVLTIVTRNNLFRMFSAHASPSLSASVLVTGGFLGVILVLAYFLAHNIQLVLDFIGGIFGIVIMLFCPAFSVTRLRKMEGLPPGLLAYLIAALGALLLGYNLFL
jgi:amino acid permease